MAHSLSQESALFERYQDVQSWGSPIEDIPVIEPVPSKLIELPVPLYRQIYTLSCEAASLQMVLAYRGIATTQDTLLSEIGISEPYESYKINDTMIWGDPNLGFVGDVRGLFSSKTDGMRGATGWGVNNGPIARVGQKYRSTTEALTGYTTVNVMRELDAGNPVIIWHVPDSYTGSILTYLTPGGKEIRFFRNHVAVVSGYKIIGEKTFFTIQDPLYGTYTLTGGTLERRMAKYNGDVVVVR